MAEPKQQIGFEQVGIGSVLRANWLRVPPNQREYSWTDREVRALLTDTANALNKDAQEYFLGSIVTIPRGPTVLEVVDGQQRLATTAILLAAIRDHLRGKERDKLIVDDVENQILASVDRQARQRIPRLRLNVRDNAYFESRVLDGNPSVEATSRSHRLISRAAQLAAEQVARIVSVVDEKQHGDALNRWIDFLERRAIVVLMRVPSEVNAYKMFETLNDRGLKTSQSDLVKNYLFGESADRLEEGQEKWASMRAILESVEEEEGTATYLRHTLISLYGYMRDADVYENVQKQAAGATGAMLFLSTLESGAVDYTALQNPDHERWNQYPPSTRRAIETLGLIRIKPMRPLLMAVTRTMPPVEADKSFRLLINASVRFFIVGGSRSGSVEEMLATVAHSVSRREITTAVQLLAALERNVPNDAEFEEAFKVATVGHAGQARYYLRSLEMRVKGDRFPSYVPNDDQAVINLEHVLPRKPLVNWPQFSAEEADLYWRRIGNMVLLQARANSDLSSLGFLAKVAVLRDSPFELTSQVAQASEWNKEDIAGRQATLAGLAVETWPLTIT